MFKYSPFPAHLPSLMFRAHTHTADLRHTCTPTAMPGHFHIASHLSVCPQDSNRPPSMPINPLQPTRSYFWFHLFLTSEKKHCFCIKIPTASHYVRCNSCEAEDKYGALAEWYWQGDTTRSVTWTGLRVIILIIFTGKTEKCFPTKGSAENCEGFREKSWEN